MSPPPDRPGRQADPLPLFPLGTVLFPGGVLPLRVFEVRYVDMVRSCLRDGRQFGVCLITQGKEVGQPAEHVDVGCAARIADCDMLQQGVLEVRAIGERRFRVLDRSIARDGLITGSVEWIDEDAAVDVPEDMQACSALTRHIVSQMEEQEPLVDKRMLLAPYDYGSASWVSNRLCEVLPIPIKAKQELMALADPLARLSLVQQFLQQHKVL